ncbi:Hypothetical predicted protein [Cloeon dipterum]|uniref:Uncharacterized protein n=1 Tax=Cloeon dipterum TaxID=197152 RepID=A0A8S1C6L5_9INSE|nr:Hypothetical predicted protein [Cloeon dipterum]
MSAVSGALSVASSTLNVDAAGFVPRTASLIKPSAECSTLCATNDDNLLPANKSCANTRPSLSACHISKQQTGRADRRRHRDGGEIKSARRTKRRLNTLLFSLPPPPPPLAHLIFLLFPPLDSQMLSSQLLCLFSVIISFYSHPASVILSAARNRLHFCPFSCRREPC